MAPVSVFHLVLTAIVALGGIQDWRSREVSNWLTIPLYFGGLLAGLVRLKIDPALGGAILIAIAILTWAALRGWMGGADYKVLVGLFGMWPQAGFAALLASGVWGGVVVIQSRDRNAKFPGVMAMAVGVVVNLSVLAYLV